MNPVDVLIGRPHVLLDFDGPVCSVFGGITDRVVAQALRAFLTGLGLDAPEGVAVTRDPFEVLQFAASLGEDTAQGAERELTRLEVTAIGSARPTPGVSEALGALRRSGHTVTIVSNNSEAAVRAYLRASRIDVSGVSARTASDPALLKPHPNLLLSAMEQLVTSGDQCVMIGDSVTDIQAARAAGTAVIGYANKPGKRATFERWKPDAIVDHMRDIVRGFEKVR